MTVRKSDDLSGTDKFAKAECASSTVATLVERLRNVDGPCEHRAAKSCGHCNLLIADVLVDEAADALESKDAEIERLRADTPKVEWNALVRFVRFTQDGWNVSEAAEKAGIEFTNGE